jgi:hypothetical protein
LVFGCDKYWRIALEVYQRRLTKNTLIRVIKQSAFMGLKFGNQKIKISVSQLFCIIYKNKKSKSSKSLQSCMASAQRKKMTLITKMFLPGKH